MIEHLPDDRIVPFQTALEYLQIPERTLKELAADRHHTGMRIPSIRVTSKIVNFYVGDLKKFATNAYTGVKSK
ncbi:MAG: hypothetical protein Unbinned2851contig1000_10 [Prokaryotic dsDNA virus sp.]|nr:MAG: hypothetical protein Unbinned2851contig1000_10 [Prokaryotic dsDNA virus sp.]|tara:strand:+ start:33377 stop:33595 length:219 start_codon:yes stop_codon:yes gene_type:complete